ncbi:hypothetical protein CPC08DRAFT_788318 [Agrocybe pediades]|nr:hypothetical protein CPC08DRAFT_788318 [Agrocybe pediades]
MVPSTMKDSSGDSLGGFGSALVLKRGTFKQTHDGKFSGTFLARPDRGYNVDVTVDYQARQHEIDFVFSPYTGSANLSFSGAQKTLQLKYRKITYMYDRYHRKTSGLDPTYVRNAQVGSKGNPLRDPDVPVVSNSDQRLVLDVEGLVANKDGSFWISDEYGPYIYRFSASGDLIQTIQPPNAVLPRDASGSLNFTSMSNPKTGRSPNQGFENPAFDEDNGILYAMLQSATIQDGGDSKTTSRYTRLFAYDVSRPTKCVRLVGEWVVPLPQNSKNGKTYGASEMLFVSPGVFLVLSRDGDGKGSDDLSSKYKKAGLFSISKATDIHNTKYDDPTHPIAVGGILNSDIRPAEYVPFVDYLDPIQLARFGLHNGGKNDATLIASKWESLALAPVNERAYPNDYYLFTAADNDFMSRQGVSLGKPYDAGVDVDNQVLVFRVTLPSVKKGSVERFIGI